MQDKALEVIKKYQETANKELYSVLEKVSKHLSESENNTLKVYNVLTSLELYLKHKSSSEEAKALIDEIRKIRESADIEQEKGFRKIVLEYTTLFKEERLKDKSVPRALISAKKEFLKRKLFGITHDEEEIPTRRRYLRRFGYFSGNVLKAFGFLTGDVGLLLAAEKLKDISEELSRKSLGEYLKEKIDEVKKPISENLKFVREQVSSIREFTSSEIQKPSEIESITEKLSAEREKELIKFLTTEKEIAKEVSDLEKQVVPQYSELKDQLESIDDKLHRISFHIKNLVSIESENLPKAVKTTKEELKNLSKITAEKLKETKDSFVYTFTKKINVLGSKITEKFSDLTTEVDRLSEYQKEALEVQKEKFKFEKEKVQDQELSFKKVVKEKIAPKKEIVQKIKEKRESFENVFSKSFFKKFSSIFEKLKSFKIFERIAEIGIGSKILSLLRKVRGISLPTEIFGGLEAGSATAGALGAAGSLFSRFAGFMSGIGGKILLPIAVAKGIFDAFTGWKRASEISGKSEENLNIVDRLNAAVSSVISGLTLGLVPEKFVYKVVDFSEKVLLGPFNLLKDLILDLTVPFKKLSEAVWNLFKKLSKIPLELVKAPFKFIRGGFNWIKKEIFGKEVKSTAEKISPLKTPALLAKPISNVTLKETKTERKLSFGIQKEFPKLIDVRVEKDKTGKEIVKPVIQVPENASKEVISSAVEKYSQQMFERFGEDISVEPVLVSKTGNLIKTEKPQITTKIPTVQIAAPQISLPKPQVKSVEPTVHSTSKISSAFKSLSNTLKNVFTKIDLSVLEAPATKLAKTAESVIGEFSKVSSNVSLDELKTEILNKFDISVLKDAVKESAAIPPLKIETQQTTIPIPDYQRSLLPEREYKIETADKNFMSFFIRSIHLVV